MRYFTRDTGRLVGEHASTSASEYASTRVREYASTQVRKYASIYTRARGPIRARKPLRTRFLRTFARKFSNIDFLSENITIER